MEVLQYFVLRATASRSQSYAQFVRNQFPSITSMPQYEVAQVLQLYLRLHVADLVHAIKDLKTKHLAGVVKWQLQPPASRINVETAGRVHEITE